MMFIRHFEGGPGAEAQLLFASVFAARLKSCPFTGLALMMILRQDETAARNETQRRLPSMDAKLA
jgi:hypothetical protein